VEGAGRYRDIEARLGEVARTPTANATAGAYDERHMIRSHFRPP
jgi:hypothetical protein